MKYFQSGQPGLVTCLSCDELNTRGGSCGYNSFEFSSDKSYYAMSCDGPHVPQVYLYQTNPNQRLTTLVDNSKLSADLASKSLPKVSNLNIPVDGGKYQAKVGSGALSLVQIHRDTGLSLVEQYHSGARVDAIITQ